MKNKKKNICSSGNTAAFYNDMLQHFYGQYGKQLCLLPLAYVINYFHVKKSTP